MANDARSKQFLKILPGPKENEPESMIQRVVRQIKESGIKADINVATSISQRDAVTSQVGEYVNIVTEPSRRHTFPAICLACEYLSKVKECPDSEVVVVLPCDPFTEIGYYDTIMQMTQSLQHSFYDLILMGIPPLLPSSKYGYILPDSKKETLPVKPVVRFKEKPDVNEAKKLIEQGALWNAGVFAFRLGYLLKLSDGYILEDSFQKYLENFDKYPETSFDYEVSEKVKNMGVIKYTGKWKDLGTWNTITDELEGFEFGNVTTDGSPRNTHILNELNIPMLCLGTQNLIVAASPDGIIVSDKSKSETVKQFAGKLKQRPMYEERRWGTYKVVDYVEFPDGFYALTKQLTINPGASISYQKHSCRDEVWTFIDGEGEIVLDGIRTPVKRGDVKYIPKGQLHALKANTSLTFIEVQHGSTLIEEDIERFPYEW